jgi:hypothetical protein
MVNRELVELCQTVIGAVQETDNFDAPTLRKLLIHIVPQLLAELDILGRILEAVQLPEPIVVDATPAPDFASAIAPDKKKKKRKKGRRK